MKYMAIMGMLITAMSCLENGLEGGHVFSDGWSWIWFILAVVWLVYAIAGIKFLETKIL